MTSAARIKVTHRLPVALARLVADQARSRRVSQTAVMEAALSSFFSADGAERLEGAISRRLDRHGRQNDRIGWKVDVVIEALSEFVLLWFDNMPQRPGAMTAAAEAKNKERWAAFVDALARRLESGERVETRVLRDIAARQALT
ncbi:CopG family transcriptional regulator [Sphingomonas sp. RT2P30]|uniref:CopG family transcriptional regulator n=1 Tax=Parasphingomonas halimpatiens TaxID=3096162 RepID=UPI002FC7D231